MKVLIRLSALTMASFVENVFLLLKSSLYVFISSGYQLLLLFRCVTIQNSLKHGVSTAVTKLLGEHTSRPNTSVDTACTSSSSLTPKRRLPAAQQSAAKRRAVDKDTSSSPNVVVSTHACYFKNWNLFFMDSSQ